MTDKPKPPNCDDVINQHVWNEPFTDGDSCECGRFYLDLHPVPPGAAAINEGIHDDETARDH